VTAGGQPSLQHQQQLVLPACSALLLMEQQHQQLHYLGQATPRCSQAAASTLQEGLPCHVLLLPLLLLLLRCCHSQQQSQHSKVALVPIRL
jgi:hypothetical protein